MLAVRLSARPNVFGQITGNPEAPSKPAHGRLEAIDPQILDKIAVIQGVMISGLGQAD